VWSLINKATAQAAGSGSFHLNRCGQVDIKGKIVNFLPKQTRIEFLIRMADASLARFGSIFLTIGLLPFLAFTFSSLSIRPLWNDELFTYYIGSLASLSEVWQALATGGEQMPYFYYIIMWNVLHWFGASEVTVRLPSFLGFLVGLSSIFFVLRRRIGPSYAAIGAMLPAATGFASYLSEGRPYGLLVGFTGLALCAWQAAGDPKWRRPALLLLTVSLFVLPGIHYFGVLILPILVLGEALRERSSHAFDLAVIAVLFLAPLASLGLNLPLLFISAKENVGTFWASRGSLADAAYVVRVAYISAWSAPILAMSWLVPLAIRGWLREPYSEEIRPANPLPPAEWAIAIGASLLPFLGLIVTYVVKGAFVDRYFIQMIFGVSIITATILSICFLPFGRNGSFAKASAMSVAVFLALAGWQILKEAKAKRNELAAAVDILQSDTDASIPIVSCETHKFLELSHYAQAPIKDRLVYLSNREYASRWLGVTSVEKGMYRLVGPWFRTNVADYDQFLRDHRKFLLFCDASGAWVHEQLASEGWSFELRKKATLFNLFEVRKESSN
jgi:hypothetical protein